MDSEQTRIEADLRGLLDGDVHCNPLFSQIYASDASVYELRPLGVVRPRTTKDVSELLRYCNENQLQVFARGGGSGLAGQSLGRGIIVDFSRYMTRVSSPTESMVRVQSGVVQADLNRSLGQHGFLFGPDPATRSVSSIGSMLSIDAAGSHFPRYGSAGDCVEALQVVLANGEVVELGRHKWAEQNEDSTTVSRLAFETGLLLQKNSALLLRPPWAAVARGCGYRFEEVLDGDRVDLARLLCGSEGSLALITEATLRIEEIPKVRGLILLFFARLETAARAVLDLEKEELAACDLMDRRLLEIARETEPIYESIVPRGAEAMLLVELQGEEPLAVRRRLTGLLRRVQRRGKSVVSYRLTTDRSERNLLWRLARRVIPRLHKLKGDMRPLPFVEDLSIPPNRLPEFLLDVQNILKKERVTATVFAHALHGQVDVRPFLDLANPTDQLRVAQLSESLCEKVLEFGGCISGEHAMGMSRAGFAEKQLGPRLELSRKIKRVFDPAGVLNPGKYLSPAPPKVNENLRPVPKAKPGEKSQAAKPQTVGISKPLVKEALSPAPPTADTASGAGNAGEPVTAEVETSAPAAANSKKSSLPLLLHWDDTQAGFESIEFAARSCNGCGRCRTSASAERMCPVFRVHKGEEAAPRAKANALRGILTGALEMDQLESRELKAISDLCFNCHQCKTECPASVNIPKLVQEAKAQHVASHGLPINERLLNRVDLLAALGSRFPRLANWALANPRMRWILERTFGIAQGRKLPRVARRSFLHWAGRQKLNRIGKGAGRKVLFFVDQYVNWHNPLLGRAVVEVFRQQDIDVYIPTSQTPSWMALLASGEIVKARKLAAQNVKLLSDAVRSGYHIVAAEPSAALCLKEDYHSLFGNEDTQLIAENTQEICSYLWNLHLEDALALEFKDVGMSVVYHQPCHARVLDASNPALKLLQLVPGLSVETADSGCSGMAGTFGLQRKNFRMSVRIGRKLINKLKDTEAQFGATECTSCKLQMEQGTTKPTVHPVAVLAYAYGKMPQLGAWFTSRTKGLVVS
ncbi:MAG: anaerobic glycerol-3-phosphate dehydrogenase subunit C [Planctomycetota bacterium]